MNDSIPQSIDVFLKQLHDDDPHARYEAVCFFARAVFVDRFDEVYEAVWKLTKDPHEHVRWSAGIAASMMLARHFPLMNKGYISITNDYIPDFLGEWQE